MSSDRDTTDMEKTLDSANAPLNQSTMEQTLPTTSFAVPPTPVTSKNAESIEELTRLMLVLTRKITNQDEQIKGLKDKLSDTLPRTFDRTSHNIETSTPLNTDNDHQEPRYHTDNSIRIKEAIEIVPIFDGYKPSIYQFIKLCEKAKSMISSSSEYAFSQVLFSKLRGHAKTIVENVNYTNVEQLLTLLRNTFAPHKTADEYRGELASVYMKEDEHIIDYINRVRDLELAILDCESRESGLFTPQKISEINNKTLDRFIDGLIPNIKIRIKTEPYSTLEEAFTIAIHISKQIEIENTRYPNLTSSENVLSLHRNFRSAHRVTSNHDRSDLRNFGTPRDQFRRIHNVSGNENNNNNHNSNDSNNPIHYNNRVPDQRESNNRFQIKRFYDRLINQSPNDRNNYRTNNNNFNQSNYSNNRNYNYRNFNNPKTNSYNSRYNNNPPNNNNNSRIKQNQTYNSNEGKFCELCSLKGHNIQECRKFAYLQYIKENKNNSGNPAAPSRQQSLVPREPSQTGRSTITNPTSENPPQIQESKVFMIKLLDENDSEESPQISEEIKTRLDHSRKDITECHKHPIINSSSDDDEEFQTIFDFNTGPLPLHDNHKETEESPLVKLFSKSHNTKPSNTEIEIESTYKSKEMLPSYPNSPSNPSINSSSSTNSIYAPNPGRKRIKRPIHPSEIKKKPTSPQIQLKKPKAQIPSTNIKDTPSKNSPKNFFTLPFPVPSSVSSDEFKNSDQSQPKRKRTRKQLQNPEIKRIIKSPGIRRKCRIKNRSSPKDFIVPTSHSSDSSEYSVRGYPFSMRNRSRKPIRRLRSEKLLEIPSSEVEPLQNKILIQKRLHLPENDVDEPSEPIPPDIRHHEDEREENTPFEDDDEEVYFKPGNEKDNENTDLETDGNIVSQKQIQRLKLIEIRDPLIINKNNHIKFINENQEAYDEGAEEYVLSNKLQKSKEVSKFYYDKRINPVTIENGDKVFLLNHPRTTGKKFADQYKGPYTVLQVLDRNNIKILMERGPKIVHRNQLKMYKGTNQN